MPEVVVTSEPVSALGKLWGLEGRHRWDDRVTLNNNAIYPRFHCRQITGLNSLGDPEDKRDVVVGRYGENSWRSLRRGKTVSYEGDIEALNLAQLREAARNLRAAFADTQTEKQMVITPHPDYDSGATYYWAKALDCTIAEEQAASPHNPHHGFSRAFAVSVRWSDARYYDAADRIGETADMLPGGGAAPPLTPPFVLPAPGVAAGTVSLEVFGTAPTDPIVNIYGPIRNPVLENITHGIKVSLRGITLGATDFVRLLFRHPRRILLGGTSDASFVLDEAESSWWASTTGLPPGVQTLRLSGENAADPARAEFSWHDAYW